VKGTSLRIEIPQNGLQAARVFFSIIDAMSIDFPRRAAFFRPFHEVCRAGSEGEYAVEGHISTRL
jgi:hypothetical protein